MKIKFILLAICSTFLTSCNGQTKPSTNTSDDLKEQNSIGKDTNQLGNHLWYVFQDSKNNYWFGSDGEGVFYYRWKSITKYSTKDGLWSNRIRQIKEDKLGNMYFATLGGINKFDGKKITSLEAIKSKEWKLEENDLWFNLLGKRDENGPYRYDGEKLYNLEFPKHYLHDQITKRITNPFFSPYEVYCIYKDRKGAMWFGTSNFGACRYDGQTLKWMYEEDITVSTLNGGSFGIRSIFEDKNGAFWICNTAQKFIFDFDKIKQSDRLHYMKTKGIGNKETFGGDELIYYSHIIEDKEGNIWLTTWDQGVFKYDGKTITHYAVKDEGKAVNLVSMYKDNTGNLWLGSNEKGCYKFNGNTFERFKPKAHK